MGLMVVSGWMAYRVGAWLVPQERWAARAMVGFLTILGAGVVAGGAEYVAAAFTPLLAWVTLVIFMVIAAVLPVIPVPRSMPDHSQPRWDGRALLVLAIGIDIALLILFGRARTDVALASPWMVLPWAIFPMYGVATAAFVLASWQLRRTWVVVGAIGHAAVTYSVVTAVYAIGFGYDPFIHRAAETHIAAWGVLFPKQPYYIGQYVLVVALHWFTALPIRVIDILFVPMLAAVTIPTVSAWSLARGWGIAFVRVRPALWCIFLLPVLPFVFTVPYHVGVVLGVWMVCLLPVTRTHPRVWWSVTMLAIAALLTHPLIGAPVVVLVLGFACMSRWGKSSVRWIILAMTAMLQAAVLPGLFAWNNLRVGAPMFRSGNPLLRWQLFANLFRDPFAVSWPVPWMLEWLYAYRQWMPWVLAWFGVLGCWLAARALRIRTVFVIPASAIGLLGAVAILATTHTIPGVVEYEQQEFVLRLLAVIPLVLLPGILVCGAWCADRMRTDGARAVFALVVAGAATASWYFTYPQVNAKAAALGWGASAADVAIVDALERSPHASRTLVLADQMLAAVAIERHGFAVASRYPVPAQPLATHFVRIAYAGIIHPETLASAAHDAAVDRVAVVLHSYWPWYHLLSAQLAAIVDTEEIIHRDAARLFIWERPTERDGSHS